MKKNLRIYNGFGITPTTNYTAAGHDFYVPNIKGLDKKDMVYDAFSKSYKKTFEQLDEIYNRLSFYVSSEFCAERFDDNELNIMHLFLSLNSAFKHTDTLDEQVELFVRYYLLFDENGTPGMSLCLNDHIFVNSGIKVALDKDTAGIFFNKSGKGNKGFDVRACVVDEDYAGYVHLSLAYTSEIDGDGIVYCGDKITQMVILNVVHHNAIDEVDETEYSDIMSGSKRGIKGFGSGDEKH